MSEPEDFVTCRICGGRFQFVNPGHLKKEHGVTMEQYRSEFPEAPLISGKVRKKMSIAATEQLRFLVRRNRGTNNRHLSQGASGLETHIGSE